MAFLRQRCRSVPPLPLPRFALGLASWIPGCPVSTRHHPARGRYLSPRLSQALRLSAYPSFSWPDEQKIGAGRAINQLRTIIFLRTTLAETDPGPWMVLYLG